MYGSRVSKSAGGSLKARWLFSPMPTNDVDGRRGDRLASGPAHELRILLAVQQVRHRDARWSDQPLLKVLPEARRMRGRHREVLVEMEQLDLGPWQILAGDERLEKLEL